MKLRFTITLEQKIAGDKELDEYYEATSLAEAVINQQRWVDEGSCDIVELVCNAEELSVVVEGLT